MLLKIGKKLIEFDENSKELKIDNRVMKPSIRTYEDMKNLYLYPDKSENVGDLYYMFRNVYLSTEDEEKFSKNNLRYDVTIIPAKMIGNEYNKTHGHYHPLKKNGKTYEEVYEILYGEALFLQQNPNTKQAIYTKAKSGDVVLMKEDFGHITINPSSNFLVMANIVSHNFSSIYGDYKENKGGAYYLTKDGFIENENYLEKFNLAEENEYLDIQDIYSSYLNNPIKFNFLN